MYIIHLMSADVFSVHVCVRVLVCFPDWKLSEPHAVQVQIK